MEKVWEVRWTTMAADEFESTIDWLIENWNFEIAEKFSVDVWGRIQRLSKHPFTGRKSSSIKDCRQTVVLPYHILIYKIFEEHIEIIRVFDGRQNPSKLLQP